MRVLVKRLLTDEFLTETGNWTPDPSQARDFQTSAAATTFCRVHRLRDSEPVLKSVAIGFFPLTHHASHADVPLNDF